MRRYALCLSFSHFRSKWRKTVKKEWFGKNTLILPLVDLRQMVTARDAVWMANSLKSLWTGSLSNLVTERNPEHIVPRRMSITYALYALRSVAGDDSVFGSIKTS